MLNKFCDPKNEVGEDEEEGEEREDVERELVRRAKANRRPGQLKTSPLSKSST